MNKGDTVVAARSGQVIKVEDKIIVGTDKLLSLIHI